MPPPNTSLNDTGILLDSTWRGQSAITGQNLSQAGCDLYNQSLSDSAPSAEPQRACVTQPYSMAIPTRNAAAVAHGANARQTSAIAASSDNCASTG